MKLGHGCEHLLLTALFYFAVRAVNRKAVFSIHVTSPNNGDISNISFSTDAFQRFYNCLLSSETCTISYTQSYSKTHKNNALHVRGSHQSNHQSANQEQRARTSFCVKTRSGKLKCENKAHDKVNHELGVRPIWQCGNQACPCVYFDNVRQLSYHKSDLQDCPRKTQTSRTFRRLRSVLSSRAYKPPSSGSRPPSSGSKPPSSGSRPPSSGSKPPSSGSNPPSNGGELPSSGSRPPSNGGELPSSGSRPPSNGGELPSSGSRPPSSGWELPSSGSRPPLNGDESPPSGSMPQSSGDGPPFSGSRPPSSGWNPPIIGSIPSSNGDVPPSSRFTQPSSGWNPPSIGSRPPLNGYEPPSSGFPPPSSGWKPPSRVSTPPSSGWEPHSSVSTPPPSGWKPSSSGSKPQSSGNISPPVSSSFSSGNQTSVNKGYRNSSRSIRDDSKVGIIVGITLGLIFFPFYCFFPM